MGFIFSLLLFARECCICLFDVGPRNDDAHGAARAARLAFEDFDVVGDRELAVFVAGDQELRLVAGVLVVVIGLGGLVVLGFLDLVDLFDLALGGGGVGVLAGPGFACAHEAKRIGFHASAWTSRRYARRTSPGWKIALPATIRLAPASWTVRTLPSSIPPST